MADSLLARTILFCLFWVLLGVLLNLLRARFIAWNAQREKPLSFSLLLVLSIIYLLMPAGFMYYQLPDLVGMLGDAALDFWAALGELAIAGVIPLMVAMTAIVFITLRQVTKKKKEATDNNKLQMFLSNIIFSGMGGLFYIIPVVFVPVDELRNAALALIAMLVVLMLSASLSIIFGTGRVRAGHKRDFDESPLLDDLNEISNSFCDIKKPWKISPLKKRQEDGEVSSADLAFMLSFWKQNFKPYTPDVPILALQNLSQETILAIVSLNYAFRMKPNTKRKWYDSPWFIWPIVNLFCFIIILLMIIIGIPITFSISVTVNIVVMMMFISGKNGGLMLFGRKKRYHNGYEIWKQTQSDQVTALDYLRCLMDFDRLVMYNYDENKYLDLVRGNRHMIDFLKSYGFSRDDISLNHAIND